MAEQEELQGRRNNYFNATINYGKVVTDLVSITSRAWNIFESSSIERKRQLLGLIASNFTIDGKNLCVELNSPFDVIAELNKTQEWGGRRDLNPRPPLPQRGALTN